MEKRSLGLIETMGYTAAIEAADAATKSADVVFVGYEINSSGLIVVKFLGDVGAVKAAVAAGTAAAAKIGTLFASHVIPRPDDQISITPSAPAAPERPKKVQKEPEPSAESSDKPADAVPGEKKAGTSGAGRKGASGKPGRRTSGSKGGAAGKKTRGK